MEPEWKQEGVVTHAVRVVRSYAALTGRELLRHSSDAREVSRQLYYAPFVVVSHGTEDDPILNYGNEAALRLWERAWKEFVTIPSRLTAEPPNREERARLLEQVRARGFIDDYSGVRISSTGKRFRIHRATVWNVFDENNKPCGQAATFSEWTPVVE